MTTRRFELHRDTDVTGVSGTGVVAEGMHFVEPDICVLRWTSQTPTSVVFHEKGLASVVKVHGHGGATRIVWLDDDGGRPFLPKDASERVLEVLREWYKEESDEEYDRIVGLTVAALIPLDPNGDLLADAEAIKVAVCEYLLSLNEGEERPFIPPTAIDWLGDGLTRAVLDA